MLLTCSSLATLAVAQQTPKVTLDENETLFSILAGMNACGYDQDLPASVPLRTQIRAELARTVQDSPNALSAEQQLCKFYDDHKQPDSSRDLAQYVSLALYLGEPPDFAPIIRESDLPPDASYVLGVLDPLKRFYAAADIHGLFAKHKGDFDTLIDQASEPVRLMIQRTDAYLRLPISGYLGRRLVIYLEPMAAPGQVNARNYGNDYFLVVSPAAGGSLKMDQIRHTYLHFVLDPLAMKRGTTMKRLEPMLEYVKHAPMDNSFKYDVVLLVNECLIRAIEARQIDPAKREAEPERRAAVESATREGFVLTPYFYEQLIAFERDKDAISLNDAYPDLLHNLTADTAKKVAENTQFATQAAPDVVRTVAPKEADLVELAESRLASGDVAAAQQFAKEALDKNEDPARAFFVLARAATLNRDMAGARTYFERTLEIAREPRVVAWSHIYLGRIYDLQEERDAALAQYRAALQAGDTAPDTKAAAERGLKQAYEPPAPQRREPREQEDPQ